MRCSLPFPKKFSNMYKIDLNKLDLNRVYTFKEFEFINNELKTRTLKIDGKPISLLELDENGKLIPIPQSPISMEAAVAEIARQLGNWNIQTRQGGVITTSQGGFNFADSNGEDDNEDEDSEEVDIGDRKIRAPDVSFTPKETYCKLDTEQLWTFRGDPFTPEFVVEVGDIGADTINSKFKKVDKRIRDEYLAAGISVQLAWLIDPKNRRILIYKRGNSCKSYCMWKDISDGDGLPGFTLDVSLIDYVISQESFEDKDEDKDEDEDEDKGKDNLEIRCPLCKEEFDNHYDFMRHYEKEHILKQCKTGE